MSHFIAYVCVAPQNGEVITSNKAEDRVSKLLAPFDENIVVEEYEDDCHCIGNEALKDSILAANEKTGISINEIHRQYWKLLVEEQTDKKWKELFNPWDKARNKHLDVHPLKGKPSPDCHECSGTGRYMTTYNPKSKWDWWVIGGRFDGEICNLEPIKDRQGGFNFGDKFHTVERNLIKTEIFLKRLESEDQDTVPFAFVTSKGEWFECGQMGLFGMSSNEKDEPDWFQEVVKLLKAESKDSVLVSVDCHI